MPPLVPWPPAPPTPGELRPRTADPDGAGCTGEPTVAGALAELSILAGATGAVESLATVALGATVGSGFLVACLARGRGFATIVTGTAPAIGESPLMRSGTTAACGAPPSSAAGVPPPEDPPARTTRPIAKKHANTTAAETASGIHCPRSVASGPPIDGPSRR